jgi:Rrf2 family transcriptional regulator, cysteine metabolism repressor
MKFSTRCRYGIRAMIEIAHRYKQGPVKRKDISKNQKISSHYLENILITLKSQHIINTVRGASGGFTLERSPKKITMYQIVTALEGSIVPSECIDTPDCCNRTVTCAARKFWVQLHEAQMNVLTKTTLQDLLDMEATTGQIDYSI